MKKRLVLILVSVVFFVSALVAVYFGARRKAESSSPCSILRTATLETATKDSKFPYPMSYPKTVQDAIEVRRQFVNPVLEILFRTKIDCPRLVDDDTAFNELKAIYDREEGLDFLGGKIDHDFVHKTLERGGLTPELEQEFQQDAEGHITFFFPNRYTFNALACVILKHPCSKAAPTALLTITKCYWNDFFYRSRYFDDERHFLRLLFTVYKDTWENYLINLRC